MGNEKQLKIRSYLQLLDRHIEAHFKLDSARQQHIHMYALLARFQWVYISNLYMLRRKEGCPLA